jgi:hypothetical protein
MPILGGAGLALSSIAVYTHQASLNPGRYIALE